MKRLIILSTIWGMPFGCLVEEKPEFLAAALFINLNNIRKFKNKSY